jgi:uncharacterized membrane protein
MPPAPATNRMKDFYGSHEIELNKEQRGANVIASMVEVPRIVADHKTKNFPQSERIVTGSMPIGVPLRAPTAPFLATLTIYSS